MTNANLSGTAGITNANLANSSVTVGSTAISLGSSATTIVGLSSVTSTAFTGSLSGTASFATSASYALTAQTLLGSVTSASFASTASFLTGTVTSASFATTASFVPNTFVQGGNSFGATATLGTNDNQPLALETNGSTRLFVSSSGNVGIGTLTPQRLFDVFTTTNTSGIIASFGAGLSNNNFSGIGFGYVEQGNTSYRKSSLVFERTETHGGGSNASGKIHFLLNNNGALSATAITDAVVTIDSVGTTVGSARMGIGTRFPTASLHISGTVAADNLMRVQSVTGAEYFFISGSGNVGIGTTTPGELLEIYSGNIRLRQGYKYAWRNSGAVDDAYISSTSTSMSFNVYSGSFNFISSAGSGNVGIGTNAPQYKLDVSGSGRFTSGINVTGSMVFTGDITGSNALFTGTITAQKLVVSTISSSVLYSSGSNKFGNDLTNTHQFTGSLYQTGSTAAFMGNVGIGTASPTQKLHISKTDGANELILTRVENNTGYADFGIQSGYARIYSSGSILYAGSPTATIFYNAGNTAMTLAFGGNLGIGTTTPNARLDVSGSATIGIVTSSFDPLNLSSKVLQVVVAPNTSAGLYVRDYNDYLKQIVITPSNGSTGFPYIGTALGSTNRLDLGTGGSRYMTISSTGNVGIGTTTPSASLHVAGTTILSSSFNTAISGSTLKVQGSGSALPIFTVVGSQGELFSINDSLSGSLFSVNDISGLPILEVFSDNTILLGNYQAPTLYTTNRIASTITGSNVIYSFPTSSYDGVFMDYTVKSGSNARAGNFAAIWSGTTVNYMDNSTTDFGSTAGMVLSGSISGSNLVVFASGSSAGWTFKGIIKAI